MPLNQPSASHLLPVSIPVPPAHVNRTCSQPICTAPPHFAAFRIAPADPARRHKHASLQPPPSPSPCSNAGVNLCKDTAPHLIARRGAHPTNFAARVHASYTYLLYRRMQIDMMLPHHPTHHRRSRTPTGDRRFSCLDSLICSRQRLSRSYP